MSDAERYERVVRHLLRTKLEHDGAVVPKILHRASFTGASGQSYEIDLAFELRFPDGDLGPIIMPRFRWGAPIGAELPQGGRSLRAARDSTGTSSGRAKEDRNDSAPQGRPSTCGCGAS
jgi:hypothetical protein